MAKSPSPTAAQDQAQRMERYYKFQSKIYDSTRWSFLFGRIGIINKLPFPKDKSFKLLEVGCGTGYNLKKLCQKYPKAEFIGMDVSTDMIRLSTEATDAYSDRVTLVQKPYTLGDTTYNNQLDGVLFSYSLTMINPQWPELIDQAYVDLKPGGFIAFADFHYSKFKWFKNHMGNHHVRMDAHILPVLKEKFTPIVEEVRNAYGGVWQYAQFVGRKA